MQFTLLCVMVAELFCNFWKFSTPKSPMTPHFFKRFQVPLVKSYELRVFSIDPKGDYLKKVASIFFLIEVIGHHWCLKWKLADFSPVFKFFWCFTQYLKIGAFKKNFPTTFFFFDLSRAWWYKNHFPIVKLSAPKTSNSRQGRKINKWL